MVPCEMHGRPVTGMKHCQLSKSGKYLGRRDQETREVSLAPTFRRCSSVLTEGHGQMPFITYQDGRGKQIKCDYCTTIDSPGSCSRVITKGMMPTCETFASTSPRFGTQALSIERIANELQDRSMQTECTCYS